jgi:hypothetical protein
MSTDQGKEEFVNLLASILRGLEENNIAVSDHIKTTENDLAKKLGFKVSDLRW